MGGLGFGMLGGKGGKGGGGLCLLCSFVEWRLKLGGRCRRSRLVLKGGKLG